MSVSGATSSQYFGIHSAIYVEQQSSSEQQSSEVQGDTSYPFLPPAASAPSDRKAPSHSPLHSRSFLESKINALKDAVKLVVSESKDESSSESSSWFNVPPPMSVPYIGTINDNSSRFSNTTIIDNSTRTQLSIIVAAKVKKSLTLGLEF